MTNTAALTEDLIAELDTLQAQHAAASRFEVYADPNIPGLAWQAVYVLGDDEDDDIMSGPVGPPIGYDDDDEGHGFRAAQDQARELLDEVERAGYPVGR